ncbi:MAG: hypothetical protein N2321_04975 [Melioribacteraceae bacterium]|nr:hypothetical protein [Melioribacteraceae bacterium]
MRFIKKYFTALIFWGIILFIYFKLYLETKFIQDDAFTTLRYVKNFIQGNGLVFNLNERVEGYTNFLWLLILSGIYSLSNIFNFNIELENLTLYLSSLFGFVQLIISYFIAQKLFSHFNSYNFIKKLLPLLIPFMILFTTPFIYWSFSGMETSLFATLTILSIYYFNEFDKGKNYLVFLLISTLNSFLRPEGLVFFILLLVIEIVYNLYNNKEIKIISRLKNSLPAKLKKVLIYFVIIQFFYIGFRLIYFGYPLPNTYYAKTEYSFNFILRGLDYFIKYFSTDLFYGVLFLPTIIRFLVKKYDRIEFIIFLFSLKYIVLTIIIGGDVLPIGRFYIPITSLVYIIFIYSLISLLNYYNVKINVKYFLFITIIILLFSLNNYNKNYDEMIEKRSYEIGLVTKMKSYAKWINKNNSKNVTVALSTIGAFSFYTDAKIIDIVGLTDSYIAHNPKEEKGINEELPVIWKERHYNTSYVMSRKPDYIIFPAGAKPSAFAECAIFINDDFLKNYYLQLFYSDGFNQLLPIFTLRKIKRKDETNCNPKFLAHYINANNLFLSLTKTKNRKLLNQILNEADLAAKYCPKRISEINAIKGMSFYHSGNYNIAKKYFENSIIQDSMNSISLFYLINTYTKLNEIKNAEKMFEQLKKISPNAIKEIYEN